MTRLLEGEASLWAVIEQDGCRLVLAELLLRDVRMLEGRLAIEEEVFINVS